MNDAIWDVLPSIALEEYWIERDGELAKGPAFFIVASSNGHSYNLLLNGLGSIRIYKTLKQAQNRIKELIENGNYPMKLYRKRRGKVNPHPFAENLIQRIEPKKGCPLKAFNIPEWEPETASVSKQNTAQETEKHG